MTDIDVRKLNIKAKHVIEFPQGLIGFCESKRYVLVDDPASGRFLWLTSLDKTQPSFAVMRPEEIVVDYAIDISAEDKSFLGLNDISDAEVFIVVTIPEDVEKATANLRSPLLINPNTRVGKQVILDSDHYPIRHALLKVEGSTKIGSRT